MVASEYMPMRWAYVHIDVRCCQVKVSTYSPLSARNTLSLCCGSEDEGDQVIEHGAGRGLVGDETVDHPSGERGADCGHLGRSERGGDGRRLCGHLGRNAGEALVGAAFDQPPLGVKGPARHLADGTQPHHLK